MKFADKSCSEFIAELASKKPVPGGGGAAALVGAAGTALGSMVCNLTVGKKKYAQYEKDLQDLLTRATKIMNDLLRMIDEDAENFLPLSKAYGMPDGTEEEKRLKREILEKTLKQACRVPVEIVKACYEAIRLHAELVDKCSRLAVSDVGVGVQCLRAALLGGMLNVTININSIQDRKFVEEVRNQTEALVQSGVKLADEVYRKVESILNK
ncbi:cyclodeaminase/cyclohydrolase family protein [Thermoanaerobacterium sp. DL9XJH110]|uniref:cyclodeaminase/cyclohydrolase family protein n=1 Tax=Thermoanaerobacterium sp. DL9XJH110 TaxID=3386643 RepID=UPI003BB4E861